MSLQNMINNLDTGRDLIISAIQSKGQPIPENSTLFECVDAILRISSGDGYVTFDATINPENVLAGEIGYGANGRVVGSVPTVVPTLSDNVVTIPKGYIASNTTVTVAVATAPQIIDNQIRIYQGYNTEEKVYNIGTAYEGRTITPGTENQIINRNSFITTTNVVILGDADLVAENIKMGGTIFGVTGTHTGGIDMSDADATGADLLFGKVAYTGNGRVVGSIQTVTPSISNNIVTISKGYLSSNEIITIGTAVGGRTITPGTSSQRVPSGSYLLSDVIVEGDANLIAENIKANVTIFGVKGNYAGGEGVSYELGVLVEENEKLKYQGLTFDGKNAVYNGATEDFTPYIYNILSKEPDYSNIDNNAVTPTNELEAGILLEQNGELVIQPISYEGLVPSYESNVETDYEIVSFESVANEPNYGVGIMNKVTTGETATNDGLIQNLDLEAGVLVMKRDKTLAIQMMSFNETIPAKYDAPISTYYVKMFETKENEPVYGGLEYVNN